MLKVCFKHFIYDFCIDLIFRRIKSNFNTAAITGIPKKGEYLSKISHKEDDEHYYNCIVKNVRRRVNSLGKKYYVIDITYGLCDGAVFDDMDWLEDQMNDKLELLTDEEYEEYEEYCEENKEFMESVNNMSILLDEGDADSIENQDFLSLRYDMYYFYR